MSYVLYSDHRRRIMLTSPQEKEKRLHATMTIFVAYHTISSAINVVNGVLYVLGPNGLGVSKVIAANIYDFGRISEFLRNLYMFLPPVVVFFVTLDRLLALLLNIDYNERAKRMVIYSDLLCLALMTLIVAYYQYYKYFADYLISIGVAILNPNQPWQYRFTGLLVLKAIIGGLNAFNCFAFMYQSRNVNELRARILKISALLEIFLGIIPSFIAVYYYVSVSDLHSMFKCLIKQAPVLLVQNFASYSNKKLNAN
ncbi:hypothetical protein Ddc_17941 [Ditylenchus destructor]|nr:hypothetical protein Ddc_17941 [Ditylenchus destructor]